MKRGVGLGLVAALVGVAAASGAAIDRTVVVLLFDGFAPALVDALDTPALDRMRREGVYTHHFEPAFPSISLTNQVTISTGCWPEHHGIVTNVFLDPQRGRYDHDADADWLTGCEHLFQAAERQGVRSAALAWVGAHSATRGPQASVVESEKNHCREPVEPGDLARADQVVRLLGLPDAERPRLVVAYFCGPDDAEHFTGMGSAETRHAVEQSDAIVARVLAAIDALGARDRVALLVTTDHGMREITHIVNVKRILADNGIAGRALSTGTTSFVYLDDPASAEAAAAKLARYAEFDVLRRGALPEWAHLGSGPRVGDLILSAHPPYFIEDTERWPAWAQWIGDYGPEFLWARFSLKATHGYPPDTPGMHGILYAWGSGIAAGRELRSARAVDLHPTAAHLLGIEPGRPVDGEVLGDLLAEPH
jgi:predicted AlkP superfamily pyrophosphatase or phosphodiesterase